MKNERRKRRHVWTSKQLRKHRFSFKGIGWKAEWYWERESYCNEDHEQRRSLEKKALQKVMIGYEEDELYFPRKWKHRPYYWW